MAGRMLPLVVPGASSTSWGSVVAAAAGAGGRALVAGCGGHLLFRFVVHHLVPLLLRRLRRRRRRRQQPRPPLGPASARADTDGAGECEESESERAKKNAKVGGEEAEEEEEERDGPVTPLPPADNVDEAGGDGQVKPERCGMWWWLWDGSQNRESLRLGAFLASSTHLLPPRHALHQHLTCCAVCAMCCLRSDGRLSRGGVCAAAITRHR